jgi:hypothetical protein
MLTPVIAWRTTKRRPDGSRHIALLGHNMLMAEAVIRAWSTVGDDRRLRGWLFMPWRFRRAGRALARDAGMRFAPGLVWARVWAWDLVIVATHVEPLHPKIPVVRVLHGIGSSSKIVRGHEFTYGPSRVLRADGSSRYARIFESSEERAHEVQRRVPGLVGHVAATGSLAVDELLERQNDAALIRREMGFVPSDRVIVSLSTFGPHSLMETVGQPLMEQMRQLTSKGRYRFVVCTHPNLWAAQRRLGKPWDEFLHGQRHHGLTIIEPGDGWISALAAADAAISDHTSLATAFALLGKPLAFVSVAASALEVNSTMSRLIAVSPTLSDPSELEGVIDSMLAVGPLPELRAIASQVVSHPGHAASRTRDELYRALAIACRPARSATRASQPSCLRRAEESDQGAYPR